MKKLISSLILCFCFTLALAQNGEFKDVIELKDGNTIQGQIIEWVHGEYVIITLAGGSTAKFPFESIKKIRQVEGDKKVQKKKEYLFTEQGVYHASSFDASLNEQGGYGFSHVVGWQVNRKIGVGLGTGIHSYTFNDDKSIIPVFVEARSFLMKKNISPYISIKGGYGFALKNEDNNMTAAEGGLFFHPEIGYRLGAAEDINFMMGLGIKIQKAKYTYEFPWAEQTNIDKMQFERLVLKLGISF